MHNRKLKTRTNLLLTRYWLLVGVLCCFGFQSAAQKSPTIRSEADTTYIKIGEQIQFKISVDTDTLAQVIFPEGQTFSPLETVEAYKTDTTKRLDRMTLEKIYALTQFDSGSYILPVQRIEINGQGYFTDSIRINVATVPVDTVNQKMFDIKPLMTVQKSGSDIWKIVLLILIILALLGAFYWFFIRNKKMTEAEAEAMLPAYDRALLELKRLENSRYLIQDEYKKYYSELTAIVRSYLEEDVHISALESTTNQLIDKIELLKDAGQLKIEDDTIDQFKKILETADLVKFARSKPETSIAEQDRKAIEQIVIKTKEAIPEPTEEELMQQAEYQQRLVLRNRKKRFAFVGAAALIVVLIASATSIYYYGFKSVKDTVLGHPSKSLLEGEWISSSYGYPPIDLVSPEVLIRQESTIPPELKENIKETQTFAYYNPDNMLRIGTSSTMLTQPEDPNYEKSIDLILKAFVDEGAKNIITKQEEFTSISGVPGLKVYGSGTFPTNNATKGVKGKYTILLFGGKGFQQQIVLSWEDGDTYAEEIVDRIINSVDVKTQV